MMRTKEIKIAVVLIVALAVVLVSISGALADDTGWKNPSDNAADTGGDGDGFENNPGYAYHDGAPGVASNINNGGVFTGNDRHRYFDYGFSIPSGSTIDGIEVQLDWYLDSRSGTNRMHVELSWDGGLSWTTAKKDSTETTTEHTTVLGGPTDTWGRSWSTSDFSDDNFRVRLRCYSQYKTRDFYLDWVPVKVYYTPLPDLIITDKHENWIDTNTFNVSYKVKNQGCAPAGASKATLYVDGSDEEQVTPALDPDESTGVLTFTTEVNCPCGDTVTIKVCADNGEIIDESDETNNCVEQGVVCPKPDLIITDKHENWVDTNTFNVSYKVKNQGPCPAGASKATLYVDGFEEHQDTPALDPDESTGEMTFDYEVTCPCGDTVTVKVCADNNEAVDESDETNNCELNFVDRDLVITDIWTVDSKIYYKIENKGSAKAPRSYSSLYVDGVFKRIGSVNELAPGKSSIESFWDYSWTCTSPEDTIDVCADYDRRIAESNEDNNYIETWTCPTPTPTPPPTPPPTCTDLVITDVWHVGSKIYYKIENIGGAAAPVSYSRLYIDGRSKRSDNVKTLEPGESSIESFSYRWSCTSTADTIKVCADHTKRIAECIETNNCRTETWYCPTPTPPPTPPPTPSPTPTPTITPTPTPTPPSPTPTPPTTCPDLAITDVWHVGSKIYYKIENIGGAAAPVSYSRLYIDGRSKRSDNVKTLAPGESSTESFRYRWSCTSTTDTIKVCADHTQRIAECDETNNCRAVTWTC